MVHGVNNNPSDNNSNICYSIHLHTSWAIGNITFYNDAVDVGVAGIHYNFGHSNGYCGIRLSISIKW